MLVLTRKRGQKIMIGDDIEITVVDISPSAVRIGIDAPKDVPILRQEIVDKIAETGLHGKLAQLKGQ